MHWARLFVADDLNVPWSQMVRWLCPRIALESLWGWSSNWLYSFESLSYLGTHPRAAAWGNMSEAGRSPVETGYSASKREYFGQITDYRSQGVVNESQYRLWPGNNHSERLHRYLKHEYLDISKRENSSDLIFVYQTNLDLRQTRMKPLRPSSVTPFRALSVTPLGYPPWM
jgi:hypothetical protein